MLPAANNDNVLVQVALLSPQGKEIGSVQEILDRGQEPSGLAVPPVQPSSVTETDLNLPQIRRINRVSFAAIATAYSAAAHSGKILEERPVAYEDP